MDKIVKNKWQVRLVVLGVFLLGFAAGALALNTYESWARHRFGGRDGRRGQHFERMIERLNLSAEQKEQVHQIFADTQGQLRALRKESEPRFEEIRRQTDERIQKVLTPEQWQQFQQMKGEARGGKRGRGRKGGEGPPHPDER